MSKSATLTSGLIIGIIIGAIFCDLRHSIREPEEETQTEVKRDTVISTDTLFIKVPIPDSTRSLGRRLATLPSAPAEAQATPSTDDIVQTGPDTDSARVWLDYTQRHYRSQEYEAWVSGYDPSLDSLRLFRKTETLTETRTETRWRTRRWGLSVGAGATVTAKGDIRPGLFIGATYTFFAF